MLVLGVDPGSRVTGFGLVEKRGNKLACVHAGIIRPEKEVCFQEKLHLLFQSLVDIIQEYRPNEMAIEDIFYAKNVKSALKLGHARGALLIAAAHCGVGIFEYTPLEIKKSVVGYGRGTKEQVQYMMKMILGIRGDLHLDTTDALAAAVCHLNGAPFRAAAVHAGGHAK